MTRAARRYTARWIVPVTSSTIEDGALLIDERGRIASVGPASHVPGEGTVESIALGEAVLMPGLVNVHAHLDLSFLRGRIEDRAFADWIQELLAVKHKAALTPDETLAVANWSCVEALAAGMTTVATTEDAHAGFDALQASGMRGIAYREVFGPDPAQADVVIEVARDAIAAQRPRDSELVRTGISPHAPFSVSDALYRRVAQLAASERLPLAAHIAESEDEKGLVTRGEGIFAGRLAGRGIAAPPRARSPIALLAETGVLDVAPLLIHCVQLDDVDLAMIASAGAAVAHCPIANARFGHGIAPVPALLDAGIAVALGTDSVASNNRLDLFEEARFAQLLQRSLHRDITLLPADRLARMVTIDGARALGLAGSIGSLEVGKDADLCCVSFDSVHNQPVYDPLAALFHSARASDVRLSVVKGRVLYSEGVWHTIDVNETRRAVRAIAARAATEPA